MTPVGGLSRIHTPLSLRLRHPLSPHHSIPAGYQNAPRGPLNKTKRPFFLKKSRIKNAKQKFETQDIKVKGERCQHPVSVPTR